MKKRTNELLFQDIHDRTIFVCDNLDVMRKTDDETVDLIYLDPPFGNMLTWNASNRSKIEEIKNYFLDLQDNQKKFLEEDFEEVFKNVKFDDTWKETDVNISWQLELIDRKEQLYNYINEIDFVISGGKYYLFYMAIRILEMHRILKDTGSIYLHCDHTMGHYLKGVMDIVFGYDHFRSEIVWNVKSVSGYKSQKKGWIRDNDTIFYYVKNNKNFIFNKQYQPYREEYLSSMFKQYDEVKKVRYRERGKKRYYENQSHMPYGCNWNDIYSLQTTTQSREIMGYPTQKPLALLERIINASSNEGDVVLDPFCGCATTLIAAERLKRKWIGIDKNRQAFYMNYWRMRNEISGIKRTTDKTEMSLFGEKITEQETDKFEAILFSVLQRPRTLLPKRSDEKENEAIEAKIAKDQIIDEQYREQQKESDDVLRGREKKEYRQTLKEKQRGRCKICKAKLYDSFHLDRILPGSKGGKYTIDNLQVLCINCNLSKNQRSNIEFAKQLFNEGKIDIDIYKINIEREFMDKRISDEAYRHEIDLAKNFEIKILK